MLNKLRHRFSQTVEELHEERLQQRYRCLDVVPIGEAPLRVPIRVGGEVQGSRWCPGPALRLSR